MEAAAGPSGPFCPNSNVNHQNVSGFWARAAGPTYGQSPASRRAARPSTRVSTYDAPMARVGAVVRRDEDYGVVTSVNDTKFDVVEVEWSDGSTEWVKVSEVEWIVSRE
jgi:hypothetical protein